MSLLFSTKGKDVISHSKRSETLHELRNVFHLEENPRIFIHVSKVANVSFIQSNILLISQK